MVARVPFAFSDLERDCCVETGCHQLDGKRLGARVYVPLELFGQYPYNASAYTFLQELREGIREHGTIEFPDLPLNPTNHTVAMRHPAEHSYSDNPYLNRFCQEPHQDTPPYPTAFWLGAQRRYAATWVMSSGGLNAWSAHCREFPAADTEARHRALVEKSLLEGSGLLFTQKPGLLLFDNSERHPLFHARTCIFSEAQNNPEARIDTPAYAFNEMGLLNYIDVLDSRRGSEYRDPADQAQVEAFLLSEGSGAA